MNDSSTIDAGVTVRCAPALVATRPRVSVCIVTYNQAAYIGQAIESVLRQETDVPFEVIVGDDCSTDGTREIADAFARDHPARVRAFLHDEHYPGIPAKRNMVTNLQAARGEYVALLDGDDYWISPDKLERQVALLDARPDLSFSFHNAYTTADGEARDVAAFAHAADGSLLSERFAGCLSESGVFTLDELTTYRRGPHRLLVPASSLVFRRRIFPTVPGWFWHVWSADRALQMHLARRGDAYYHHDLYCGRRKHSDSMTVRFRDTLWENRHRLDDTRVFAQINPRYRPLAARRRAALYRRRARIHRREGHPVRAAACLLGAVGLFAGHHLRRLLPFPYAAPADRFTERPAPDPPR